MKPWLQLSSSDLADQLPDGEDQEVHFPAALVEAILSEYTTPGQTVLDPFAGFGTTLVTAEVMNRRAIGVELLPDRVDLIRSRLTGAGTVEVINGDARKLSTLVDGPVDLCLTSPPYMDAVDHPENPLNAYETLDGDYATYLDEIAAVFGQVASLLRPGGHAIVNVANMRVDDRVTTLAWDVGRAISRHLTLRQESFLCWDRQPEWLTGDYCLVFQRPVDSTGHPYP
ncbi:DNA methyltransferase [Solwaraspora sp. WMMD406]|uniref:TRM11 family SAM-dependent methyltransferase n=1 Tax=Solwaraspora sp. WMMD406 TaxID=3016095 RepID=UPI0024160EE5|nr:DNA methyltransferase [Solwaraspora sp. WMMD406]MDG4766406.1 DNA methyltransferase [Solwaraspora sp. WMMD406]